MIKIVEGDILKASEDIIGHQVNCMGVMGAGLAKQIRNKYPIVYKRYVRLVSGHNKESLLGFIQTIDTYDGKIIANIFGQLYYGRGGTHTSYDALKQAFERLLYMAKNRHKFKGMTIALPYGIGCGLAGGDWNKVYKIIQEVFSDYGVTLYKYQ